MGGFNRAVSGVTRHFFGVDQKFLLRAGLEYFRGSGVVLDTWPESGLPLFHTRFYTRNNGSTKYSFWVGWEFGCYLRRPINSVLHVDDSIPTPQTMYHLLPRIRVRR